MRKWTSDPLNETRIRTGTIGVLALLGVQVLDLSGELEI
jgi:hypothetical protein